MALTHGLKPHLEEEAESSCFLTVGGLCVTQLPHARVLPASHSELYPQTVSQDEPDPKTVNQQTLPSLRFVFIFMSFMTASRKLV